MRKFVYLKVAVLIKSQLRFRTAQRIVSGTSALCYEGDLLETGQKGLSYGNAHIYQPIFEFLVHIVCTDEAHVDPTSQAQGRVLREEGHRDDPEKIEERPHVGFHIAAWGKAERRRFYHDEEDTVGEIAPAYPQKLRREDGEE
jgi:hypothetical protein